MRYLDQQEFNFEKRKHPVIKRSQETRPKGMLAETGEKPLIIASRINIWAPFIMLNGQ